MSGPGNVDLAEYWGSIGKLARKLKKEQGGKMENHEIEPFGKIKDLADQYLKKYLNPKNILESILGINVSDVKMALAEMYPVRGENKKLELDPSKFEIINVSLSNDTPIVYFEHYMENRVRNRKVPLCELGFDGLRLR